MRDPRDTAEHFRKISMWESIDLWQSLNQETVAPILSFKTRSTKSTERMATSSNYGKFESTGDSMAEKRTSGVSGKVFDVFLKNPDQILSIFDLIRLTGLTQDQCRNAISNLRSRNDLKEIEVIIKGSAYRYNTDNPVQYDPPEPKVILESEEYQADPEPSEEDDWIELRMLGRNKAGQMIVQDEDNKMYTLEAL